MSINLWQSWENIETITLENAYIYKTHESPVSVGAMWHEIGQAAWGCF